MLDLGMAHGSLGEARRARTQSELAYRLARECGAAALVHSHRAGPAEDARERAGGLTHAEWRVAALAARGHTNREIAGQLFVTPSTVEQHLTRVFKKLKVKQREDLPLSLGLHGPDPALR
ncbi:helix-turn-helix domain-containing protein [Streptomyces hiroshimensis]|uniref:HTH luxR-type domain-containing protein n=1 Tax=Streptomyces hiroshimensis TaxID=66424 RepID=A0ABQ2Z9Q0_9ACTN|nr:helix-turn-helix transcriptional regulator [Streptomyces hiroshimensis]GGY08077.1 hypothetical protein GCM10010324_63780 [Streptomyces hiroshimensis]